MSDELREEIARALSKNDDKCRNLPWPALRRGIQDAFISDADTAIFMTTATGVVIMVAAIFS